MSFVDAMVALALVLLGFAIGGALVFTAMRRAHALEMRVLSRRVDELDRALRTQSTTADDGLPASPHDTAQMGTFQPNRPLAPLRIPGVAAPTWTESNADGSMPGSLVAPPIPGMTPPREAPSPHETATHPPASAQVPLTGTSAATLPPLVNAPEALLAPVSVMPPAGRLAVTGATGPHHTPLMNAPPPMTHTSGVAATLVPSVVPSPAAQAPAPPAAAHPAAAHAANHVASHGGYAPAHPASASPTASAHGGYSPAQPAGVSHVGSSHAVHVGTPAAVLPPPAATPSSAPAAARPMTAVGAVPSAATERPHGTRASARPNPVPDRRTGPAPARPRPLDLAPPTAPPAAAAPPAESATLLEQDVSAFDGPTADPRPARRPEPRNDSRTEQRGGGEIRTEPRVEAPDLPRFPSTPMGQRPRPPDPTLPMALGNAAPRRRDDDEVTQLDPLDPMLMARLQAPPSNFEGPPLRASESSGARRLFEEPALPPRVGANGEVLRGNAAHTNVMEIEESAWPDVGSAGASGAGAWELDNLLGDFARETEGERPPQPAAPGPRKKG